MKRHVASFGFVVGCLLVALSSSALVVRAAAAPASAAGPAVAVPAVAPEVRAQAEAAFREGVEAYDQANYDGAVDRLFKAVSLVQDPRYYTILGRAQSEAGSKELAFFSFKNALDRTAEDHEDYEGLLTMVVSTGLDLGRFDEVEPYLEPLGIRNPDLAASARTRLWIERGQRALNEKRYSDAYGYFATAAKTTTDDRSARSGQASALRGMADEMDKAGRPARRLDILLRLQRLEPSARNAADVVAAFKAAGEPAKRAKAVARIRAEFPEGGK